MKNAYFELVSYPVCGAAMINEYQLLARRSMVRATAGDCQTPEDVAKSSKDVARYVLAYCYMCMNEQQLAQQLLEEILNSGRCNQSTPVLRIGNNSVIGYSDVVRLMNGEGNDDYNIGW